MVFSLSGGELQAFSYLITLARYTIGFKDFPIATNPFGTKFFNFRGKTQSNILKASDL